MINTSSPLQGHPFAPAVAAAPAAAPTQYPNLPLLNPFLNPFETTLLNTQALMSFQQQQTTLKATTTSSSSERSSSVTPPTTTVVDLPVDLSPGGGSGPVSGHQSVSDWSVGQVAEFIGSVDGCKEYQEVSVGELSQIVPGTNIL